MHEDEPTVSTPEYEAIDDSAEGDRQDKESHRLSEMRPADCQSGSTPPITRQMLRMIGMPFTLSISRAQNELGYQPIVTWERGIAAMWLSRKL